MSEFQIEKEKQPEGLLKFMFQLGKLKTLHIIQYVCIRVSVYLSLEILESVKKNELTFEVNLISSTNFPLCSWFS